MLNSFGFRLMVLALGLCPLITGGCASTKPSRFYTLSALATSETGSETGTGGVGLAIGIGPITLPEHLDREQIVTRTSRNEIRLAEFDRWAGSLKDGFSRVLAENLSILLPTDRVSLYPWRRSVPIDYQIVVDVSRFDGELGGNAWLIARWTLFGGSDKEVLSMGTSRISEPSGAQGYAALVGAESRALGRLSREIAEAITTISKRASNQ
jgi:uncharacterized lipoprotein YmbA